MITGAFTGRPARALCNRLAEEYSSTESEPLEWLPQSIVAVDIFAASQTTDNVDYSPRSLGRGYGCYKMSRTPPRS